MNLILLDKFYPTPLSIRYGGYFVPVSKSGNMAKFFKSDSEESVDDTMVQQESVQSLHPDLGKHTWVILFLMIVGDFINETEKIPILHDWEG